MEDRCIMFVTMLSIEVIHFNANAHRISCEKLLTAFIILAATLTLCFVPSLSMDPLAQLCDPVTTLGGNKGRW